MLDVPSMVAIKASESASVSVHLISDMKAATLDLSRAVRYPAMMIFILSIGNAMAISLSACDTSRISASPSLTNSIAIYFPNDSTTTISNTANMSPDLIS